MDPKCVTVWCALWIVGIIGTFFFENANGEYYRNIIPQLFVPQMEDIVLEDI